MLSSQPEYPQACLSDKIACLQKYSINCACIHRWGANKIYAQCEYTSFRHNKILRRFIVACSRCNRLASANSRCCGWEWLSGTEFERSFNLGLDALSLLPYSFLLHPFLSIPSSFLSSALLVILSKFSYWFLILFYSSHRAFQAGSRLNGVTVNWM